MNLGNIAAKGAEFIKEQMVTGLEKAADLAAAQKESLESLVTVDAKEAADLRQGLGKSEKSLKKAKARIDKVNKALKAKGKELLPLAALKKLANEFSKKHKEHRPDVLAQLAKAAEKCKSKEELLALVKSFYPKDPLLMKQALSFLRISTSTLIQSREPAGEAEKAELEELKALNRIIEESETDFVDENKSTLLLYEASEEPSLAAKELGRPTDLRQAFELLATPPLGSVTEINAKISAWYPGKRREGAKKFFTNSIGVMNRNVDKSEPIGPQLIHINKVGQALQSLNMVDKLSTAGYRRISAQFDKAGALPAFGNYSSSAPSDLEPKGRESEGSSDNSRGSTVS